ncbi:hypothetical protein FTUN_7774 [Frigoriglobus tundricola]|uniref:Uncharacterized protein n=1 Tax=Frigoriglobus tundricola TaxID=2774151 RepID=A0A6M5Z1D3_9BACT|nr:hypothetical protein FTUN_7774 [Frigoriglobus tundricola]
MSVAIRDLLCGVPPRVSLLAIASPGALFFSPDRDRSDAAGSTCVPRPTGPGRAS